MPTLNNIARRVSGKPWKLEKSPTVQPASRTQSSAGHKTKWHVRMEKTKRERAVKQLEIELKQEKQAELRRKREITLQRQKANEERLRLEQEKATIGARKSARLRRRAGRTKKING